MIAKVMGDHDGDRAPKDIPLDAQNGKPVANEEINQMQVIKPSQCEPALKGNYT